MPARPLDGQVAAITGAGSGIGRAAALLFAGAGGHVVVLDLDSKTAEATAKTVVEQGGSASWLQVDVTDPVFVKDVVETINRSEGRVDIIYNNAGGSSNEDGPVHELALDEFWQRISIDLAGTINVCRAILPDMMDRRSGVVVNTASIVALSGLANRTAYTAAKGGVLAVTRAMAVDYAPYGIRVNAVAPGITITPRVEGLLAAGLGSQDIERRHLLGYDRAEDVAHAALYLASPVSARVTGIVLPVDSGWTAA